MSTPLFRAAAVEARRTTSLGAIVLLRPLSFAVWTSFAAAAAGGLIAFLAWGTYTAHSTLRGQLMPVGGVVKVHAPQPGVVVATHVEEGQRVAAGVLLFVLSSERLSTAGATQEAIAAELWKRLGSLEGEGERLSALEQAEDDALRHTVSVMRRELAGLRAMMASQQSRVRLAEEQTARYRKLQAEGFVPREQLIARQEDAAEQRLRLHGFEREGRQAELRIAETESERVRLRMQHESRRAEIGRSIAATRQELVEAEARRSIRIVAPAAGIATGVAVDVGQATDGSRPLVSIVQTNAPLRAELLAPTRAVGFIRPGSSVLLRYPAYPYQKFGHHRGTVLSVSRAAFAAAELVAVPAAGSAAQNEPLYRVTASLPSQSIDVYGTPQPLQAGMLVEADVLQDTRRLYEWVLEPLYALRAERK